MRSKERYTITKLTTNGGPHGEGCEVSMEAIGRHEMRLRCFRCGAERVVRIKFGRLEHAVAHLHDGDA